MICLLIIMARGWFRDLIGMLGMFRAHSTFSVFITFATIKWVNDSFGTAIFIYFQSPSSSFILFMYSFTDLVL